MKKYFDSLINSSGAPVVAASISVYNYGTTTLASLFGDSSGSTTLANPLTSSSAGYFEFYAADGRYTLSISVGGYPVTTITDILLDDPTNASATVVVGGSVDNSPIGASTPSSGAFTTLSATGNATLGNASTDTHTINGVLIQSVGAGVGITTGGTLTVSSPDGVEGGQVTLKNRANTAAAFVVDVDNVDQCRVFTAQNNTNITIGQIGGATGGSVAIHTDSTERVKIDSSGNVLVTSVAGLGYGTGSGGTVTQATSKSTAVTLNKPTGQITMNNAALADATTVVFGLTNSTIGANDTVVFTCAGGFGANYLVWAVNPAAGSVSVAVRNVSGVSQSQALVINFAVIKGSNA